MSDDKPETELSVDCVSAVTSGTSGTTVSSVNLKESLSTLPTPSNALTQTSYSPSELDDKTSVIGGVVSEKVESRYIVQGTAVESYTCIGVYITPVRESKFESETIALSIVFS